MRSEDAYGLGFTDGAAKNPFNKELADNPTHGAMYRQGFEKGQEYRRNALLATQEGEGFENDDPDRWRTITTLDLIRLFQNRLDRAEEGAKSARDKGFPARYIEAYERDVKVNKVILDLISPRLEDSED